MPYLYKDVSMGSAILRGVVDGCPFIRGVSLSATPYVRDMLGTI